MHRLRLQDRNGFKSVQCGKIKYNNNNNLQKYLK